MSNRSSLKGALAGLAGNYGSGESSDGEGSDSEQSHPVHQPVWSVCVDATTGCPYYWEQITNQVSWEPPPGFVNSTTPMINTAMASSIPSLGIRSIQQPKKVEIPPKLPTNQQQPPLPKYTKERKSPSSDEEEEKIELITSFYNSDSGSGDENGDESMKSDDGKRLETNNIQKNPSRKAAKNVKKDIKTVAHTPFGPELPADLIIESSKQILMNRDAQMTEKPKFINELPERVEVCGNRNFNSAISDNSSKSVTEVATDKINKRAKTDLVSDNLDELIVTQATLLKQLGELDPSEVNYLNGSSRNSSNVNSRTDSPIGSPSIAVNSPTSSRKSTLDMDVDDLIAQIEKEQPVDKSKITSDSTGTSQEALIIGNSITTINDGSESESFKPLFPSCGNAVQNIENGDAKRMDIELNNTKLDPKIELDKKINKYETLLLDEGIENNALKRKRRIALDILPIKHSKTADFSSKRDVTYTYSTGERMGLGFKKDSDQSESESNENISKYSNFSKGVMFHKGEVLNQDNGSEKGDGTSVTSKDGDDKFDDMNDQKSLIESKLKFLVQNLPAVPPVQQLFIEFQTLWGALMSGALQNKHMYEWLHTANSTLDRLEASAAPHPWICRFHSAAGCYVYEHPDTGQWQWEYPGQDAPPPPPSTPPPAKPPAPLSPPPDEPSDMDISTTPPPQLHHENRLNYIRDNIEPLPPGVETPTNTSPMPPEDSTIPQITTDRFNQKTDGKDVLCAELDSFYSDIAALDESLPATETNSRESFLDDSPKPVASPIPQDSTLAVKDKKKKLKNKPMGMKNKSVSKLVEKWKKVQETLDD